MKLIIVNNNDTTIDVLVKTVKISISAFELSLSVGSHCKIVNAQNVNTQNVIQMVSYANELTNSANEGQKLASETTVSMDEINNQINYINI